MSNRKKRNEQRQGKLLAALHKFKHAVPFWIFWYDQRDKDEKKLEKLGLIRRARRRYGPSHARNAVVITEKGEGALYEEKINSNTPLAKTARKKEKRSRHV